MDGESNKCGLKSRRHSRITVCYTELKPEPLQLDLAFLKDCTKHSSYDEKAQIWKDYKEAWLKGMEAAERQGLPEYQWSNRGRFRANSLLREQIALRRVKRN